MVKKFEDLEVWKKSQRLFRELYPDLRDSKDYFLRDQIFRATLSVSNNIAEGFDRQTSKEFRQFLFIAKGSAAEVRSMVYAMQGLDLMSSSKAKDYIKQTDEISRMLRGLIKTLN